MATSLTFTGTLMQSASLLLSSSQLTPVVIAQGGANGSRIYSIAVQTNSTTAPTLIMNMSGSFGIARMSAVSITAFSGYNAGIATFDYFGNSTPAAVFQKNKDANGVPYFNLAPNTVLTVNTSASFITTGATASIFVNGEFY